MLQIDESRLDECNLDDSKLFVHPTVPGRFVYMVAVTREAERAFGTGEAMLADASAGSQAGERKTLPFRTNKVTTAGEIRISSNIEKVVYYEKVFKISKRP